MTISTQPAHKSTAITALDTLAATANKEHAAAEKAAFNMLEHARNAGTALTKVKAQVPHGEFMTWLRENFRGSARTARDYMRVAANWQSAAISESKSIKEALDSLTQRTDDERIEEGHRIEHLGDMKIVVRGGGEKSNKTKQEKEQPPQGEAESMEVVEPAEAAPTAMKRLPPAKVDEGLERWRWAKVQLDKIHPKDISREDALREAIKYCEERLEREAKGPDKRFRAKLEREVRHEQSEALNKLKWGWQAAATNTRDEFLQWVESSKNKVAQ